MKKLYLLFVLSIVSLFILILISGCTKPRPYGNDYAIHVVADSTIWKQAEPIVRKIFEKTEPTPQPEKLFTIIKEKNRGYTRFKNLLFISTLDAQDDQSQMINSSLAEAARAKVEQGEIMFTKQEEWAQDQKIMFLIGTDVTSLLSKMAEKEDDIVFQFEDHWRQFHKNILYTMGEQTDIEKHLLNNYGWTFKLPNDYKLKLQSARDRFVLFHRKVPLRWVSVFWEEATDPNVITKEYCINKRNSFTKNFYEGEEVEEKFEEVIVEEVDFLNRRALKLKGLWKNDQKIAGGPFRMYCFFDGATERIYFIDMHLFSPNLKKSKLHYLRQMDILAHTFKTILEVKPEDL